MAELPEGRHLGGLCKRGHEWAGTGMSLRFNDPSWACVECVKIINKRYARSDKGKEKNKENMRRYLQKPETKVRKKQQYDEKVRKRRQILEMRERLGALAERLTRNINLKVKEKHKKCSKEREKAHRAEYRRRPEVKAKKQQYKKVRRQNNPKFALGERISNSIRLSLKKGKNGWHWEGLVGYTLDALKLHLQSQFKDGMSWDNIGEWHIDHIFPISAFNFTEPEDPEFKQCWALDNLRPLWAKDNLRKSAGWLEGE